jgi:dihydrofolate synthase/folylpolyglutamate synthase
MYYTTFEQFCTYADSLTNLEKRTDGYTVREYRLDRMKSLLDYIGNPQYSYKKIHIAGSKGKGSTASFIANAMTAVGYKTGLYMSPHLIDYRERFTLSGTYYSEEELVLAANSFTHLIKDFSFSDDWGTSEITTFEVYTAFAFHLFKMTHCEWAVIETGLGGRLDATNIIVPDLSIITPIELEHTAILGNSIEKIAYEKSKIIKEGVPICVSRQKDEAKEVICKEAQEKHSQLYDIEALVESITTKTNQEGQLVDITWVNGNKTHLQLAMRGEVQGENSALALLALQTLGLYTKDISEQAIERTTLPGRMQIVQTRPPLIIDGAHTKESMRHLLNSFTQWYPEQERIVIFGALQDKDHRHMARLIIPLFSHIIICRPGTFKKSDIQSLFNLFQDEILIEKASTHLYLESESSDALSLALSLSNNEIPILCTGSFYLGGEILSSYQKMEEAREVVCP